MKYRLIFAVAVCAVLAALFLSLRRASAPRTSFVRPSIRFVGFTNVVDTQNPIFTRLSRIRPATLQSWLTTGTNAAIFTVTNHQNRTLLISAHGQFLAQGANSNRDAFLVQPTSFPEFFLGPGQEVPIQVTFPNQRAPWKVRLFCRRDSREYSFPERLRELPEALRAIAKRRPVRVHRDPIESDWIGSLPAGQTIEGAEPQHAVDGSQPFRSLTIPMSAAAGFRR